MKNNQMCAIIVDELNDDALKPLTNERPLGTLFFDCKYRLIDFELSSVVNAGIRNVQLIEDEDKVRSVFDHLGGGREWGLDAIGSYQYVNYFQDSENKKAAGEKYFNNTIEFLEKSHTAYTVIMGTRMLCNLNLRAALKIHKQTDKPLTVIYSRTDANEIAAYDSILSFDSLGNVITCDEFAKLPDQTGIFNLSMNVYIADTRWLIDALRKGQQLDAPAQLDDFLKAQLPKPGLAGGYEYVGYLQKIYDLPSYYQANKDMLDSNKMNELLYTNQRIITRTRNEVATYYDRHAKVKNSHLATGCDIYGTVTDSLISRRSVVDPKAVVTNSIVMPNARIGHNAEVHWAILDKNVVVKPGVRIVGTPDNILVVPKDTRVEANLSSTEEEAN